MKRVLALAIVLTLISCEKETTTQIGQILENSPSIDGKKEYLGSPYFTPGNRVYMVGHQDGSFPDLGWHIKGEMGGIWNHPIKLMDGFDVNLRWGNEILTLNNADTFTNYPMANKHHFNVKDKGLKVERWQFVPDDREGIFIQVVISNTSDEDKEFGLEFKGHVDLRPTWLSERQEITDGKDTATYDDKLNAWIARDENNPWYVVFGSDTAPFGNATFKLTHPGNGTSNALNYEVALKAGETKVYDFVVAGSYTSQNDAVATYENIHKNAFELLQEKTNRYSQLGNQIKTDDSR